MRRIIPRPIQALLGFVAGWLVCLVEAAVYYSAYGGAFTVFMLCLMLLAFSGLAVGASLLLGLVLLIPGVRDLWRRIGYWSLLLSAGSLSVMLFASELGLRTVDPISNYRKMPFSIWSICLFGLVFPIVNLPRKGQLDAQARSRP